MSLKYEPASEPLHISRYRDGVDLGDERESLGDARRSHVPAGVLDVQHR